MFTKMFKSNIYGDTIEGRSLKNFASHSFVDIIPQPAYSIKNTHVTTILQKSFKNIVYGKKKKILTTKECYTIHLIRNKRLLQYLLQE